MDRSLKRLLKLNRGRFFNLPSIDPINPPQPPIGGGGIPTTGPTPDTTSYILSDFGENVINNHWAADASHSEKTNTIFEYVTRDFRNRCTAIQSYKTPDLYNSFIYRDNYLKKCALVDADLIFTPYVNAAYSSEGEFYDFVLPVASHFDNNTSIEQTTGLNRHDITQNAETLLTNTVAVGARRDTPELFKLGTSYGFGMEFFEDCSPAGLDADYPDEDIPQAFAELLTTDGINLTSTVHQTFSQWVRVGQTITIKYTSDPATWQTSVVSEIVSPNHIRIATPVTPITTPSIYGYRDVTLGMFTNSQAQSWAVPIVAGKLKVIKMTTNADWDTVREAARATARRNTTGIAEIDNANWDIYRGFGSIRVNDAIEFINNNN